MADCLVSGLLVCFLNTSFTLTSKSNSSNNTRSNLLVGKTRSLGFYIQKLIFPVQIKAFLGVWHWLDSNTKLLSSTKSI